MRMDKSSNPIGVIIDHKVDDALVGHTAVPADEWTVKRQEVLEHYQLDKSTRVDCINIITALTLALEDR